MTETTVDLPPTCPSIFESPPHHVGRRIRNGLATFLIVGAVVLALIPLVFVLLFVIQKGGEVFSWEFLTEDIPISAREFGGGMWPAIVGTLVITAGAALMAVPLGILGGIYTAEYGRKSKLAGVIRFLAEVMTGVPSIVMGLFVYTVLVLRFKEQTGFAGAVALACLMLPLVIRNTDEMLRLVPNDLREGSFARLATGAHGANGRAATRGARDRERVPARNRACGGRDCAAALHDRDRQRAELEPLQGDQHRALGADLPQCGIAVRRRGGTRLRGSTDPYIDRVPLHGAGGVVTTIYTRRAGGG